MDINKSLIVFICNHGFAYDAMVEARKSGARGGTIIHGRSSLSKEKQKFLGITIHSEKDIILLVCLDEQKVDLMESMTCKFGVTTEARGVCFSMKVEDSIGFVFEPMEKIEVQL